jgi:cytochrome c oxidase cbb3-type subunit 3
MSHGVSWYIAIVALLNIVAALWLIWWTARGSNKGVSQETTQHVWDEDLTEYNNPLPRWWLGLFIITIVFGLGYLVLYPGLGDFIGLKHWSQASQWAAEDAQARGALEQRLASIKDKSLIEIAHDSSAMSTARNLFALNCSTCHGSDARGARGFPNLTDNDWLWGGDADTIYQTVSKGRDAAMPAWGTLLGDEGVDEVASYVLSLSGHNAPKDWVDIGRGKYQQLCVGCHGPEGKGNAMLGAPNLTDDVWLYGDSIKVVRETIAKGRNGHMPAHAELLGDTKVKLLSAYVLSLGQHDATHAVASTVATTAAPKQTE